MFDMSVKGEGINYGVMEGLHLTASNGLVMWRER